MSNSQSSGWEMWGLLVIVATVFLIIIAILKAIASILFFGGIALGVIAVLYGIWQVIGNSYFADYGTPAIAFLIAVFMVWAGYSLGGFAISLEQSPVGTTAKVVVQTDAQIQEVLGVPKTVLKDVAIQTNRNLNGNNSTGMESLLNVSFNAYDAAEQIGDAKDKAEIVQTAVPK